MAAARNVIILKKKWEIELAQTQDGGCVKEQIAGPQAKMTAARNVIIVKCWVLAPTQDGRCVKNKRQEIVQDGGRAKCNNI
jgi:hypothetical protein